MSLLVKGYFVETCGAFVAMRKFFVEFKIAAVKDELAYAAKTLAAVVAFIGAVGPEIGAVRGLDLDFPHPLRLVGMAHHWLFRAIGQHPGKHGNALGAFAKHLPGAPVGEVMFVHAEQHST
jgi:hypothetical protein